MNNLSNIFRFGAPYIRRYWVRMFLGVLLGVLFGISNAAILGGTKALLNRVFPEEKTPVAAVQTTEKPGLKAKVTQLAESAKAKPGPIVDPWLPLKDRGLDAKQIIGLILFF